MNISWFLLTEGKTLREVTSYKGFNKTPKIRPLIPNYSFVTCQRKISDSTISLSKDYQIYRKSYT